MVSDHYGHSHMQDASSFVFYGHMRHLLSAMSVRLWIVMYNETEIGAELGSVFTEEHTKWAL